MIGTVVRTYDAQRGRVTMTGQAAELMTPAVIERMRMLEDELRMRFT